MQAGRQASRQAGRQAQQLQTAASQGAKQKQATATPSVGRGDHTAFSCPRPRPPPRHARRILRQVASGSEKGLQAEVLKRDFSREVRNVAARTGAGA
jgi:hypothetical protein